MTAMATTLVVAITGASGSPYGVRLLEVLLALGRTVHLVISPAATEVMERELGVTIDLTRFDPRCSSAGRARDLICRCCTTTTSATSRPGSPAGRS